MKALILPTENNRICQVAEQDFPVAEPLFWIDCSDEVTTEWTYDGIEFNQPSVVAPPEPTKSELLAQLAELTAKIEALGE